MAPLHVAASKPTSERSIVRHSINNARLVASVSAFETGDTSGIVDQAFLEFASLLAESLYQMKIFSGYQ